MIYLDYNATTPIDRRVFAAMKPFLGKLYSNPSSFYRFGQAARKGVEDARLEVARLISAKEEEVVFTSGGTESNNLALKGFALRNRRKGSHIITSQVEHACVKNTCVFLESEGFKVTYVGVDKCGCVDLDQLRDAFCDETLLVSILYAQNEVGTIQPIKEISKMCKERGVYFHSDVVQAIGRIPLDVEAVPFDLMSFSAHKFYGPKGTGALYVKKGVELSALLHGGKQEKGLRCGTENVAGIVGMGEAARIARSEMEENKAHVGPLRDLMEADMAKNLEGIHNNGHPKNRLYNTTHIYVEDVQAESLVINLDFHKICVSSGSACASGSPEPSHVLLAMGLSKEIARSSLRISLGKYTTRQEIKDFVKVFTFTVEKLRKLSSNA